MKNVSTNKNARITSRTDRFGKLRTETKYRDPGSVEFAVTTDTDTNTTTLYIDTPDGSVYLTGKEARTLYYMLHKHGVFTGKIS